MMAEEMGLRNGPLRSEEDEVAVMIKCGDVGAAEAHKPEKPFRVSTPNLRRLAVASIICCCCCFGIQALIYAVKAREKEKANAHKSANHWARKSFCMCLLSIPAGVSLVVLVLLLTILISYIASQAE